MGSGWYFPVSKNQLPGLLMGTDLSPHLGPLPLKLCDTSGLVALCWRKKRCDTKVRAQPCCPQRGFRALSTCVG